jgi:hypothetical protein
VPTDPRTAVHAAAVELLRALSGLDGLPPLRVTEADGNLACQIQVWDATRVMPTARRDRTGGKRAGCKADILAVVRGAGRPMPRKQIVRALRDARTGHGPGTVAKALADMTTAGELVNPKDKRGYRLPDWPRPPRTPSLFA